MKRVTPSNIFLLALALLLLFSNWRTAKQRDAEHELRLNAILTFWGAIQKCQPAIMLQSSNNPVDAIPLMRYRDNQNGYGCVFLPDGRYGDLWWSIILENKGEKGHLEWNFNERGKYKLP